MGSGGICIKYLPKYLINMYQFTNYLGLNLKTTKGTAGNLTLIKTNLCLGKKSYSTLAGEISPVKVYKNAEIDKLRIITENKGKAGVYR